MIPGNGDERFFHAERGGWPRGYADPPRHFHQPEQLGDLVAAL